MYIFILIGVVIFILLLNYLITHWKTLKKDIVDIFTNNIGSILYIVLLFIFLLFILYPFLKFNGNSENKVKDIDLLEFSNNYRTAMILFLVVICFIFGIWTIMTTKNLPSMKSVYIIQGIIIFASIALNTYYNFDTFPYIPFVGEITEDIMKYMFWIFFLGILIYFSYYLITYKESNKNTPSISSIGSSAMKYIGIFIILLFTTRLFFKNQEVKEEEQEAKKKRLRESLMFSGGDPILPISIIAYGFILTNILYFIFNWGFIKWLQTIIIGFIVLFIIIIILFKLLYKLTNNDSNV